MSFLNEDYRDALNYCGSHSGRGEKDKFAAAGLTKAFRHDIPYPDEANPGIFMQKDGCRTGQRRQFYRFHTDG